MTASSKALEEWKERYEAYRQHGTQYLTILSISATGVVVGLVFAMSKDTPFYGRLATLAALSLLMLSLVIAHIISRPAMVALGVRLGKLETELGFEKFQTSEPLERGLKVTFVVGIGLLLLMLVLFLLVMARVV